VLLLKTKRSFQEIMAGVFTPLVILPASKAGESREESKARVNDLALAARMAGLGVTAIESTSGGLFVMASDNESQCVGFGRKLLTESKTAEPWFVLSMDGKGSSIVLETSDRNRKTGRLTPTGFVLPDDYSVEIAASYIPAQRNTAWLRSLGFNVGVSF
jgi:hypothetical protein